MTDRPFNPAHYLSQLKGKDYLEVKWRLVWLRDRHPDADITTEMVHYDETIAIFKAHIAIPGGGSATGYGSETPRDFGDYIEKAETKAIGRALAALGFGTQFCDDHDFGSQQGRVVDAPVAPREERGVALGNVTIVPSGEEPEVMASPAQIRMIERLLPVLGKKRDEFKKRQRIEHLADLSKKRATTLISDMLVAEAELLMKQKMEAAQDESRLEAALPVEA